MERLQHHPHLHRLHPPLNLSGAIFIISPIEIITVDEMSFLGAALASTRPLLSSSFAIPSLPFALSPARRHVASIRSSSGSPPAKVIEDPEKLIRPKSLIERFRARRALTVTDITSSEWCEKQTEFGLVRGKPKKTAAMEAGSNRHAELEKEHKCFWRYMDCWG